MVDHKHRFLINFFTYAGQRGIPIAKLTKSANIDLNVLETEGTSEVTKDQMSRLWQSACKLTGDPLFGLHLGESMQLSALGIVGEIIQNSNTVGLALERAAKFIGLVTDVFQMKVIHQPKTIKIKFIPDPVCQKEYALATNQIIDLSLVFTLYELKGLVLRQIKPEKLMLHRESIQFPKEYKRVFGCDVITGHKETKLIFDEDLWKTPIVTPHYELIPILIEKATHMLENSLESKTYTQRVKQYILQNSYLGVPTLEDVASNFHTSPRTLQRKLSNENTSFLELVDEIRKDLALHYVKVEKRTIKEASYMLGYNETSAFTRAFKRWTGTTPGAY
ncbi:MAG: AraC family transcriptional regulator [Fulvivirga sp.]|nr:AraC family transcriptional regulator [Fulvivirga sp.]